MASYIIGHAVRRIWEEAMAQPQRYLPGIEAGEELAPLGDFDALDEQL